MQYKSYTEWTTPNYINIINYYNFETTRCILISNKTYMHPTENYPSEYFAVGAAVRNSRIFMYKAIFACANRAW